MYAKRYDTRTHTYAHTHTHTHPRSHYLPLASVSPSGCQSLKHSQCIFCLGEAAHYAPRGANCPVALLSLSLPLALSSSPLPSSGLWVLLSAKSSGVHAERRALDLSEVPQGRKVTPSWTPIENSLHTPAADRWRRRAAGMNRMTVDKEKTGLKETRATVV